MDTNTWLSICSVAGIGESKYTAVRFEYYSVGENGLLIPDTEIDNPPTELKRYSLTGQDILISLYNLFDDINYSKCEEGYVRLIGKWCKEHIHPYNIKELFKLLPDINKYEEMLKEPAKYYCENSPREYFHEDSKALVQAGTFELNNFMRDLENLYFAVKTYHAIMTLKDGDTTIARELSIEGKYCDGRENISRHLLKDGADIEKYMTIFCEQFQIQKMELKYDEMKKEFTFVPEVNSVFDIAWYALIRHIVSDAASSTKDKINYSLIRCNACGRLFSPTCNRQKYCLDKACQSFRNNKKNKTYYNKSKSKPNG